MSKVLDKVLDGVLAANETPVSPITNAVSMFQPSRREVLRIAGTGGVLLAVPALAKANAPHPTADPLLNEITEVLLSEYPESATQLGIDTGARARLKSRLTDSSSAGVATRATRSVCSD
jgi:hypothetical protein